MLTAAFGITFLLTFTAPYGCPPEYGLPPNVPGCVVTNEDPPHIYILDDLSKPTRVWVRHHEIGHIFCSRRPVPDLSERCANRWAAKHMPRWRKRK